MENIEEITTEFFRRRFPDKDIELEKKCGYFQEWMQRFQSGNPEVFMDARSKRVWEEMFENKLEKSKEYEVWQKIMQTAQDYGLIVYSFGGVAVLALKEEQEKAKQFREEAGQNESMI